MPWAATEGLGGALNREGRLTVPPLLGDAY